MAREVVRVVATGDTTRSGSALGSSGEGVWEEREEVDEDEDGLAWELYGWDWGCRDC